MRPSLAQLKGRKNLVGVEIGVGTGVNSKSIMENLNVRRLYLIDPYDKYSDYVKELKQSNNFSKKTVLLGEETAKKNLQKWKSKLIWLKDKSDMAVKSVVDKLDFVYVDGNHERDYVKRDIELFWPKLKKGGLMAGHDFLPKFQGVIEAVNEMFKDYEVASITTDKKPNVDWWVWKK